MKNYQKFGIFTKQREILNKMGLPHSDAESVFFAPKLYAILREGEKGLRKVKYYLLTFYNLTKKMALNGNLPIQNHLFIIFFFLNSPSEIIRFYWYLCG